MAQSLDDLGPLHAVAEQSLHAVQPVVDGRRADQRLLQPAAQQALAHGGLGLVQHPEQGAPLFPPAHGLGQFQVGPGHRRELHILGFGVADNGLEPLHTVLLGAAQIGQQARHRKPGKAVPGKATGGPALVAELSLQRVLGVGIGLVFHQFHRAGHVLLDVGGDILQREGRLVEEHLAGGIAAELGDDLAAHRCAAQLGGVGLAGGNVGKADAGFVPFQVYTADVVVFVVLEHAALNDGAGSDDADDVPLHQPLSQGRVLHLLADGHLVALGDKPGHIALVAVEGHAAHGRALRLAAVPPGEGELQLFGREDRVVVEHLVKVAQPEKQNLVLVLLLDLKILGHHGGKFRHCCASPACFL